MQPRVVILLFLAGFISLTPCIPRKYYLILEYKNWTEAKAYCRSNHTDLATIETADEMAQLQTEAQRYGYSSSAWIGLYNNVDSWRWSLDNTSLGNITEWNMGLPEPNNAGGNQLCGGISRSGWYDLDCSDLRYFLCYNERYSGSSRYIYYTIAKTWDEAQRACRQDHTDLACVRDEEENTFVKISDTKPAWFGLFRDGWKWSDKTSVSGVSWSSGYPKVSGRTCGYTVNGQVFDAHCSDAKSFFCYKAPMKRQIVRMKVQSDQDVNDPAVQVAILKKIEDMLKQHGSENVTVKFRAQASRKVFEKMKGVNTTVKSDPLPNSCTTVTF